MLGLLAIMLLAMPALAGRVWCARDPIVNLNGTNLQVWVAVPEEYVYLVNGPIDVTFSTPRGVQRSIVYTDSGFNGHGEVVRFVDDRGSLVNNGGLFEVQISAKVPIDQTLAAKHINSRKIPLQITIIEGNQTRIVEMWNTGASIKTRVQGTR